MPVREVIKGSVKAVKSSYDTAEEVIDIVDGRFSNEEEDSEPGKGRGEEDFLKRHFRRIWRRLPDSRKEQYRKKGVEKELKKQQRQQIFQESVLCQQKQEKKVQGRRGNGRMGTVQRASGDKTAGGSGTLRTTGMPRTSGTAGSKSGMGAGLAGAGSAGIKTAETGGKVAAGAGSGGMSLAYEGAKRTAETFTRSLSGREEAIRQTRIRKQSELKITAGKLLEEEAGAVEKMRILANVLGIMAVQVLLVLAQAVLVVLINILILLIPILTIVLIISLLASILALIFADADQPIRNWELPPFVTEEMMKAFFEDQETYGIPVSTGVAQLIQESGFGVYGPGGSEGQGISGLAYNYKNLFGIKSHKCDSVSGSVNMKTGEVYNGQYVTIGADFSTYKSYAACVRCRSKNLYTSIYYPGIKDHLKQKGESSYSKDQADRVMKGIAEHWATGPDYYKACKKHMENYNLYQFDNMTYEQFKKGGGEISNVTIGDYAHPCPKGSYVSSHFGYRSSPGGVGSTNHKGTDIAAASGTPIYAIKDGKILAAEYNSVRGYYVKIDHGGGIITLSQHMSRMAVSSGASVKKGQLIGYVGTTGASTGAHLHFEFWVNGTPVDAEKYMKFF